MDDTIWWCRSRADARMTLERVRSYINEVCLLTLREPAQINRSTHGVSFCGYRITQGQLRLSRRRQRRYRLLRQYWERQYAEGHIDALTLQRAYDAVNAITLPADCIAWRRQNLLRHPPLELS